jgi:D-alanyl-D-alanine carboxypeptidase/D-alanyl-D-alanine-endopeptidase (penicillin-binding protein 4)
MLIDSRLFYFSRIIVYATLCLLAPTSALAIPQNYVVASPRLQQQGVSFFAVRLGTGDEPSVIVADQRGSQAAKPASLMKIPTSWLAHRHLGFEYRFRTTFSVFVTPSGDRELHVHVSGDPSLRSEELYLAAEAIASRLPTARFARIVLVGRGPAWPLERTGQRAYEAGFSQSALNFNSIAFLSCSAQAGMPAIVRPVPDLPFIKLGAIARSGSALSIDELAPWNYRYGGASAPGAHCQRVYRSVPDPETYLVETLRLYLSRFGIEVTEKGHRRSYGERPAGSTVFENQSRPLGSLLFDLNRYSSNFYAGQIVRVIGEQMKLSGRADDFAHLSSADIGNRIMSDELADLGIARDEFVIADASGLSHDNRLSPRSIVRVLAAFHQDFTGRDEFTSSLAVPGRLGTLEGREFGVFFRGKTGSLKDTRALAGYLENRTGNLIAFSIIQNGERLLSEALVREKEFLTSLMKTTETQMK